MADSAPGRVRLSNRAHSFASQHSRPDSCPVLLENVAFNNSWTLNMTDNLRFVFDAGDTASMHVRDRLDASRSWWPKFSDGKFSEDYAIVSRVLDSKTGAVLVTIAGLDHTGTRAAGDFVTDPQLLAALLKQAPKDWTRKNLQVVLHTTVVNNIPSSPTVVAVHFW